MVTHHHSTVTFKPRDLIYAKAVDNSILHVFFFFPSFSTSVTLTKTSIKLVFSRKHQYLQPYNGDYSHAGHHGTSLL